MAVLPSTTPLIFFTYLQVSIRSMVIFWLLYSPFFLFIWCLDVVSSLCRTCRSYWPRHVCVTTKRSGGFLWLTRILYFFTVANVGRVLLLARSSRANDVIFYLARPLPVFLFFFLTEDSSCLRQALFSPLVVQRSRCRCANPINRLKIRNLRCRSKDSIEWCHFY